MSYDCQGLAKYFVVFILQLTNCFTLFHLKKLCIVLHSLLILGYVVVKANVVKALKTLL